MGLTMQCPVQGPDKQVADQAFGQQMAMQMANPPVTQSDMDYTMSPRATARSQERSVGLAV